MIFERQKARRQSRWVDIHALVRHVLAGERQADRPCPCGLGDAAWRASEPLLPLPSCFGRPPMWPRRMMVEAIFCLVRSSCARRMLPPGFYVLQDRPGRSPDRHPFAQHSRSRRLALDDERLPEPGMAMTSTAISGRRR
ncbi:transposase [Geminicoccus sp.]|uniref:transposase n=1 Tax=Geminicoccus sp. TaxID=2024832 RepID=UPI0039C8B9FC